MTNQERISALGTSWTHIGILDAGFRDRFLQPPMIIHSWVKPYLALEGSRILDFGRGEGITAPGPTWRHAPAEVISVDIMPVPERCPILAR